MSSSIFEQLKNYSQNGCGFVVPGIDGVEPQIVRHVGTIRRICRRWPTWRILVVNPSGEVIRILQKS